MSDLNRVHAFHCCARHGCKYGDFDCPVKAGQAEQKYLCEQCVDIEETLEEILRLLEEIAFVRNFKERQANH